MASTAHLRPTTTQRLRTFLDTQGEPVLPGATADEVRDSIASLLEARQHSPEFLQALHGLVVQLQDDVARGRCDGLPTPAAEVLSDREIAGIIARLRDGAAVTVSAPHRATEAARPWVTVVATALAAVWWSGCDRPPAPVPETPPVLTPTPGSPQDAAAAIPSAESDGSDALEALFRDGSPDEIAAHLEAMIEDAGPGQDSSVDAAVQGRRPPPPKTPPVAVPMYKGISV